MTQSDSLTAAGACAPFGPLSSQVPLCTGPGGSSAESIEVPGWELVDPVAEGSLARVYRARATGAGPDQPADYAVKVLRRRRHDDPQAVALFRREALVARSLAHRHLVPVLAAGLQRPPYWLVMPWLEGVTLEEQLAQESRLELPAALWTARQVAEALSALDTSGWMHGDVKPSNIFISPNGHVTLLDLGFARRRHESASVSGRCLLGTLRYIAPELVTSAIGSDIRSDIYSLGVMLFEMLSGRVPFEADDLAELVIKHKQARAPRLRQLVPHVPTGVARLVREMLAKEPLRRPQTPDELIRRLAALEISTFSERDFDG